MLSASSRSKVDKRVESVASMGRSGSPRPTAPDVGYLYVRRLDLFLTIRPDFSTIGPDWGRVLSEVPRFASSEYFEAGRPPLAVVRVAGHQPLDLHCHEFGELVIVLRGTGLHLTDAGPWPIGAGDVFALHADQAHGYVNTAELDLVNILFEPARLELPLADVATLPGYQVLFNLEPRYRRRDRFASRLRLEPDRLPRIAALVDRLEAELRDRAPGSDFAALATFMLLVCDLSRAYSEVELPEAQPLLRLGKLVGYLEQHYVEPLTLDDLARIAHLSRRSLTRAFRAAYGDSPIGHLIRLRLNHAARLLAAGDESIGAVARSVGFADGSYFARSFRAAFGVSPREWRQRQPNSAA